MYTLVQCPRNLLASLCDRRKLLSETCKQLLLGVGLGGACRLPRRPWNMHPIKSDMRRPSWGGFGVFSEWLSEVGVSVINRFNQSNRIGISGGVCLALPGCCTSWRLRLLFDLNFTSVTLAYGLKIDHQYTCEVNHQRHTYRRCYSSSSASSTHRMLVRLDLSK